MTQDLFTTCPRCGDGQVPAGLPSARACLVCAPALWAVGDEPFIANQYCGGDPAGSVRVTSGDPRIIFTAAAAVNYYRGTSRMPAARNTGSLAEVAALLTGGMAITASGPPASLEQATVATSVEFAFGATLAKTVVPDSFVIDLRGMRDRSFAVCLGTGPAPDERTETVATAVQQVCARRGLEVAVNEPFAALPPWTVSHFAQLQLGVNALQIEIAASLRDPQQQSDLAAVALAAVRAAAQAAAAIPLSN